jgi:hypothetical protein
MPNTLIKARVKLEPKTQRPKLYKVILLNDDYTPRGLVVAVLKRVFRMNEDQAYRVMMAHNAASAWSRCSPRMWRKRRRPKELNQAAEQAIRLPSPPSPSSRAKALLKRAANWSRGNCGSVQTIDRDGDPPTPRSATLPPYA